MKQVSKEVKKVLNESFNVNAVVDRMYHLYDCYDEDGEDDKIEFDDAIAQTEWEINQIDNDHFHCIGVFDYCGYTIKIIGDFVRDRENLDASRRYVYSCYVDDNVYTGGADIVYELIGYIISEGWGPSIYDYIKSGKVKKSYEEEKAELDWKREMKLEVPRCWMAHGNKKITQEYLDQMQEYFDEEYKKLAKRHGR